MQQRSEEWFEARLGKVTASGVHAATSFRKDGKPSAERNNYLAQIISERLTGSITTHYNTPAMQWGTDTEDEAKSNYSFLHGIDVRETGFVQHPTIQMSGASPDGLIGEDGLLEIKCPNTATHIMTRLGADVPINHVKQMLWQMECTGRQWCDYVSFDPALPIEVGYCVRRFDRDEDQINQLKDGVRAFLHEVDQKIAALTGAQELEAV